MTGVMLAALGVVYGDIGTSPLYTLKECFYAEHLIVNHINVYGILSLVFWSIMLVVSLKYVTFILRADLKVEGGIMVLMSLARHSLKGKARWLVLMLGLLGASLFYGDAIITPAVSVLSAAEGLVVLNKSFQPFIVPIALSVLIVLFLFQRFGTGPIGRFFGPVILTWFSVLALLGFWNILQYPQVLAALNPVYALKFLYLLSTWVFFSIGFWGCRAGINGCGSALC